MNVLIKKAKVVCPTSKYHGKTVDLLIKKGVIAEIKKNITPTGRVKIIESDNLHCSIGWVDIGCHSGEPGNEHQETLDSLSQCAKLGGYTHIAPFANTRPVVDHKALVKFITQHPSNSTTKLLPIGAITSQLNGKDLSEMLDMAHEGAVAFSDGLQALSDSGILLRALQYLKRIDGVLITHAHDASLSIDGQIHEGEISTSLGMVGIPSIAEEVAISRDIKVAQYAESPIVFHAISTANACKTIKKSQKSNQAIQATVAFSNLVETEAALQSFDSNYKVKPPLRSESDRSALVKAVKSGIIGAIVSNHTPLEEEKKKLEFSYASKGITGLEVCFSLLCDQLLDNGLSLDHIIQALSVGPREILNLNLPKIEVEAKADLTLFDPTLAWDYTHTASLSHNNPYLGQRLVGKVIDTVI